MPSSPNTLARQVPSPRAYLISSNTPPAEPQPVPDETCCTSAGMDALPTPNSWFGCFVGGFALAVALVGLILLFVFSPFLPRQ